LDDLQRLANHLAAAYPSLRIGFDLGDMSGYAYYSGLRFALYGAASSDALARGGRYDEVGAVFGRNRPAVGFSLDLKALSEQSHAAAAGAAIRAPWGEEAALRDAVRRLRESGETVVYALPGQPHAGEPHHFDRELAQVAGHWAVRSI
jgi:ATP phosphoribosyltransferase regulatory subunit